MFVKKELRTVIILQFTKDSTASRSFVARVMVVNGSPIFTFSIYESFNTLLKDIDDYLEGSHFNFYVIKFFLTPQPIDEIITISDSEEIDEFATPPEAQYIIDRVDDDKIDIDDDDDDQSDEDEELDKAVELMLAKIEPQFSKIPATQGICKWGKCHLPTYRSDTFCKTHWLKMRNDRYKIAKHLRIKCQFGDGSCEKTLRYGMQFCVGHTHRTFELEGEHVQEMTIEEMRNEATSVLEKEILPLVKKNIRYYVGRAPLLQRRLNAHISFLNFKGADTRNLEIKGMIKVKGILQANAMENVLINECAFHDDVNVKKMLINRSKSLKFSLINFRRNLFKKI